MEIPEAPDDLTKDHASVVLEESGRSERAEDIEERAGGAVESEEVDV